MKHHPSEKEHFWVQLFGSEIDAMVAGGLRAVELGARCLDINMGCPVKKVTRHQAGSALLCDIPRAAALCEALVKNCGVPVTVKIRAGWDEDTVNYLEVGKALENAGCSAIALHARTRAQGYSGHANWAYIRQLVQHVAIPVIGNGDASTANKARQMLSTTGCAAVMIGRGALGNPWIFQELVQGENFTPPTPAERWALIQKHLQEHIAFVGDEQHGMKRFRAQWMWYSHGLTGAAAFRRQVCAIEDGQELMRIAEQFFHGAGVDYAVTAEDKDFEERCALG
jgi:nifR3 family TIM-barrel protein